MDQTSTSQCRNKREQILQWMRVNERTSAEKKGTTEYLFEWIMCCVQQHFYYYCYFIESVCVRPCFGCISIYVLSQCTKHKLYLYRTFGNCDWAENCFNFSHYFHNVNTFTGMLSSQHTATKICANIIFFSIFMWIFFSCLVWFGLNKMICYFCGTLRTITIHFIQKNLIFFFLHFWLDDLIIFT